MAFHNLVLISTTNPFSIYEDIVKKKYAFLSVLYGIDNSNSDCYVKVKERYETYTNSQGCLETMVNSTNFTGAEKDALLHCYNGNTKLVKELKKSIIESQNIHYRSKCTYCGIGDVSTMDHYLPKEDFFEYSVYCYNLIPCCSYCNGKKGTFFLDGNGDRKIFNPYFEKVQEEPILKCNFVCAEENIELNLHIKENVENNVWLNHLETLNIIERYKTEVPRILSSLIYDILINFEENGVNYSGARRVIKRKLNETEEIQGQNSLDAIIYREYIEHDLLFDIDYLRKIYYFMKNTPIN